MSDNVSRGAVQAFYEAFASRDPVRVGQLLADDVEWNMSGPVDVFPFCGPRRGKAAAMEYLGRGVPSLFAIKRYEPLEMVIDGDCAATFSKVTAVQRETGRIITFHSAHFVRFRDGKVTSMKSITDTFLVAEQVVGHRIDAYREPEFDLLQDVVAI